MLGVEGLAFELSELKSKDILRLLTEDNSYRSLLQEMPDAVLAHHNERIVYYNPAAEELFRTSTRSQLLGRDPVELAAPEEVDEILKRRAQI